MPGVLECTAQQLQLLHALLRTCCAAPRMQEGDQPLLIAAKANDILTVSTLLQLPVTDVNARGTVGPACSTCPVPAAWLAARWRLSMHTQCAAVVCTVPQAYWTALMMAVYNNHPAVVQLLLRHPQVDVNARDKVRARGWVQSVACALQPGHEPLARC